MCDVVVIQRVALVDRNSVTRFTGQVSSPFYRVKCGGGLSLRFHNVILFFWSLFTSFLLLHQSNLLFPFSL